MQQANASRIAAQSGKFFFRIIKGGDAEQIGGYINQLGAETRSILRSATELVYYMRGGLTYTEVMNMSAGEREVVANFVNKAMKNAKDDPRTVIMI